jgi:hypothetical protein
MSAVGETAARVRALAPVDRPVPTRTRWARPKAGLLRVLRLVTAPQAAANHATADALDAVAAELAACRAELAACQDDLRRLRHAVHHVHGPLVVDLVDRAGGLVDVAD